MSNVLTIAMLVLCVLLALGVFGLLGRLLALVPPVRSRLVHRLARRLGAVRCRGRLLDRLRFDHRGYRVVLHPWELGLSGASLVTSLELRRLDGRPVAPDGLEVHPAALDAKSPGPSDSARPGRVMLGDPAFDTRVSVFGLEPVVRARFGEAARRRWLRLVDRTRVDVHEGKLTARLREPIRDRTAAAQAVDALIAGLEDLWPGSDPVAAADRDDVPARLARVALVDPIVGVRVGALAALHEHFAGHALTEATDWQATEDPVPAVRIEAAEHLGDAGLPVLQELLAKSAAPAPQLASALGAVVAGGHLEVAGPVLTAWLARPEWLLKADALRDGVLDAAGEYLLAAPDDSEVEEALVTLALRATRHVGEPAADVLARLPPTARREQVLVALLEHADRDVRRIAQALASVGTPRALAPLEARERQAAPGLGGRRALRQAIAAIRQRHAAG